MAEKSALRLIPGRDALLAYNPQPYPAGTYVEYQTLIYKALVNTSSTFIGTEWELIGDLREVRVNYIQDRNSLTGTTVTTGNTGIHIPILDNTNVLVLNASADPQVGSNKFARYNYNKGSAKWLLLQISTGSTGSNVSDYNLLTNKPPIISGVTAIAGAALVGGIVGSGSVPPTRVTFTISHADTSTQPSLNPSGYTYVQKLKVDTYGHVTGATTSLWVHPDTSNQPSINNTGLTYIQNIGVDTDGHITSMSSGAWVHPDTSSQGNVSNTGSTVIQSIFLDTDGHVIGINSATVSTGGGGVNFSAAGNSGGNKAMPNSGVLQITGGSNINTVSSLHGSNVGVQINVVPAGSNTNVQYNNNGVLAAVAGVSITGGTTLVTSKIGITTTPVSGLTTDDFITRNPISGAIQKLGLNTIERAMVGQPSNSIQFNGLGYFSGSSQFLFDSTNKAVTLGTRLAGIVGTNSLSIGTNNTASGSSSMTIGTSNRAGQNSVAGGLASINKGSSSFAYGQNAVVTANGSNAFSFGNTTTADGFVAIAMGLYATAIGNGSIAIGYGGSGTFNGVTARNGGIAISNNASSPSPARPSIGASGNWSGIFAGLNHSIDITSTGAAIIGGHRTGTGSPGLNISGGTYQDFVNVSNLAIWTTPSAGGSDDVLTWNATSKKITKVAQGSIGGGGGTPAGANGYVQLNGNGSFGATANLIFLTGTSTLQTSNLNLTVNPTSGSTANVLLTRNSGTGNIERLSIAALPGAPLNSIQYNKGSGFGGNQTWLFDPATSGVTLGIRTGATGQYSMAIGTNNSAGTHSLTVGFQNRNTSPYGIVVGIANSLAATGNAASGVFGSSNSVSGVSTYSYTFGSGNNLKNNSSLSFIAGTSNSIGGTGSIVFGSNNKSNIVSFIAGDYINASGSSIGYRPIGMGSYVRVVGDNNIAIGFGSNATTLPLISKGTKAINISSNTNYFSITGIGTLGTYASIFGGITHGVDVSTQYSTIVGGAANLITGTAIAGTIVGGGTNIIGGLHAPTSSSIFGGNGNIISGASTGGGSNTIVGGASHKAYGCTTNSAIVGGSGNFFSGTSSNSNQNNVMIGGNNNTITGSSITNSTIIGGSINKITGSTVSDAGIFGGNSNKINKSVQRSVILGGQSIVLSGATQNDTAVVPNLMIWNTPLTGVIGDNALVWNSSSRKVKIVPQVSAAGVLGNVQFNNGGGVFGAAPQFTYDQSHDNLSIGIQTGVTGQHSLSIGLNNSVSSQSISIGNGNKLSMSNAGNMALGINNQMSSNGGGSATIGNGNIITGTTTNNFAVGTSNNVAGGNSQAFGSGNKILLNSSQSAAFGSNNTLGGFLSFAMGQINTVNSQGIALGLNNVISGTSSGGIAIGLNNKTVGDNITIGIGLSSARNVSNGQSCINVSSTLSGYGNGSTVAGVLNNIFGGSANIIDTNSQQCTIIGGGSNTIKGFPVTNVTAACTIIGGGAQFITGGTQNSSIFGGGFNKILGGSFDSYNVILGGISNRIQGTPGGGVSTQSNQILGGTGNLINNNSATRVMMLNGNGLTVTTTAYNDYVIAPSLALFTTPTTAAGGDNVLGWNSTDKKVKLGTIAATSDIRLKTDFKPLVNVVDRISKLDTYEYTNNEIVEPMKGVKNYGLTAQQVEQVFPHVVKDNYVWNEETYKTVDYRYLVPVLFAAIKELNEKIKDLESKIK